MSKRTIIFIILGIILLATIVGFSVLRFQENQSTTNRSQGSFSRDPDTGEERYGDPNQNPNEESSQSESPFMSMLGTNVLSPASLSPDQIESLRVALRQYAVDSLQITPSEVAILRPVNDKLIDASDQSLNFVVKYRPQDKEATIKAYVSPLGVSIYVGEKGPYYGNPQGKSAN